jgi:hypothetical protein
MASNIFTAFELVIVLSAFCAGFCPVLCWVVGSSVIPRATPLSATAPAGSPQ